MPSVIPDNVPAELQDMILTSLHDHMGHMGVDHTLDLVRTGFYWLNMVMDVVRKVRACSRCMWRKVQPEKPAPLVNIRTTRPLESSACTTCPWRLTKAEPRTYC